MVSNRARRGSKAILVPNLSSAPFRFALCVSLKRRKQLVPFNRFEPSYPLIPCAHAIRATDAPSANAISGVEKSYANNCDR